MEPQNPQISKSTYYFSIAIWTANIVFAILSFFFEIYQYVFAIILISCIINGFVTGVFKERRNSEVKAEYKRTSLDYCLIVSKYVSMVLAIGGLISIFVGKGGPEVIDGTYFLVSHGEIVREISREWFVFFVICELLVFTCIPLYFSTYMALRTRVMYIIQNKKAE